MKKHLKLQSVVLIAVFALALVLNACKKKADTVSTAPKATTSAATHVGKTWAILNGSVNAGNLLTKITFEYDLTTDYSHIVHPNLDSIVGTIYTAISSNLSGLSSNTTYHYRVKAVNALGTTYGSDETFTTTTDEKSDIVFNPAKTYGTLNDIDNNTYKTIHVGAQTWMAENLRTTRFNDNSLIPLVISSTVWAGLSTPAFCFYNNDSVSYGALYNWYAISSGKLCPSGWHVPSDGEWTALTTYLGGDSISGGNIKETGTTHWLTPNTSADNLSGLSALPSGFISSYGTFNNIRRTAYFWSSTEFNTVDAYYRFILYNYSEMVRNNSSKLGGLSVRCIKDN